MSSSPPDPPQKIALVAASEFLKYTVALGTGALVFSAGLVTGNVNLSMIAIRLLISAWISITISIVAGVLAYSRIPIQIAEENYDLEDKWFVIPGRIHQLAFVIGIICLGGTLILALSYKYEPLPTPSTPTPTGSSTSAPVPTSTPTPTSTPKPKVTP
jgi:hypothetical protein